MPRPAQDQPLSIPAMAGPPISKDNPFTRSLAGMIGLGVLIALVLACVGTLWYTLAPAEKGLPPRYRDGSLEAILLPPTWTGFATRGVETAEAIVAEVEEDDLPAHLAASGADVPPPTDVGWWQNNIRYAKYTIERANAALRAAAIDRGPDGNPADPGPAADPPKPTRHQLEAAAPSIALGTDKLGRSLLIRCLAGGGVSIGIGLAAAAISVTIGTIYGATAGYIGGRVDAAMMRTVDVLYGLPYILLVVLLAVAGDAVIDNWNRSVARNATVARASWQLAAAPHWAAVLTTPPVQPSDPADPQSVLAAQQKTDAMRVEEADRLARPAIPAAKREVRELMRSPEGPARVQAAILAALAGDAAALESLTAASLANPALPRGEIPPAWLTFFGVAVLFIAIGGVSWLTMARVIRGQVLSLKAQPFMEAARALGIPVHRQFARHLLPNLLGPIIVYATLTVPQAILQESFLSFLGIGVKAPLPSWGNLAAEGLTELNPIRTRWWLLLFPCLLLGITLLALNFVGEGLREAFDPRRARK